MLKTVAHRVLQRIGPGSIFVFNQGPRVAMFVGYDVFDSRQFASSYWITLIFLCSNGVMYYDLVVNHDGYELDGGYEFEKDFIRIL